MCVCVSTAFSGIDMQFNKRTNIKSSCTTARCLGFGKVNHFKQYTVDADLHNAMCAVNVRE